LEHFIFQTSSFSTEQSVFICGVANGKSFSSCSKGGYHLSAGPQPGSRYQHGGNRATSPLEKHHYCADSVATENNEKGLVFLCFCDGIGVELYCNAMMRSKTKKTHRHHPEIGRAHLALLVTKYINQSVNAKTVFTR
jgi:hypothetical protein